LSWQVYIIRCTDGSLYTGITTDVSRRFEEHATGKGARYFRGRKPASVCYSETASDRSEASKRESEIKQMTRAQKEELINVD